MKVINKKDIVYIGRGSPLGNPFSWKKGTKAEFTCKNRDESLHLYELWLREKILKKIRRFATS